MRKFKKGDTVKAIRLQSVDVNYPYKFLYYGTYVDETGLTDSIVLFDITCDKVVIYPLKSNVRKFVKY